MIDVNIKGLLYGVAAALPHMQAQKSGQINKKCTMTFLVDEKSMSIRRFRTGDEAALFRVFLSSVHGIASRDYTAAQIEAWAPVDTDPDLWARRISGLRPFIVEIEGDIAGYADLQSNGYIDHFFVSGAYPRRGVGTLLMHRIHEEAKLLGISEVTSEVSKTAEPFFQRHGFQVVERQFPVRRGVTLQNAFMRKELWHGS